LKRESVRYWNETAAASDQDARHAVLAGFRSEKAFDEAGREDASHLILPFVSPSDTVLDVGCGLGRLLKWAAPACRHAIGLDISREMLKKAARRLAGLPNVTLRELPPDLRFPVAARSIDFAWFYHVSEHMDREDAFRILGEIRRCLKPGGKALVQFSLLDHPDNRAEFLRWARLGDDEGVRSRFYTEPEIATLLAMARLYPQIRLYIPGEFAAVVTKVDARLLGAMPLVRLSSPPSRSGPAASAPKRAK
jgi:SAM-dependent methyltransferase